MLQRTILQRTNATSVFINKIMMLRRT